MKKSLEERKIEITQTNQTQATQKEQLLTTIQQLETNNQSHTEDIKILQQELEDSNTEAETLTKENLELKS